ncbi:Uma2 family endonuclease, partial [Candidatus Poribacteria bacterium]|nr:Uma2 family endonuclease [Candidatus Poribacteria bacterium]
TDKKALYADVLSVQEYYIYDPYGEVHPHFQGYRLVDGVYQEIAFVDERLPSVVLGLELGERDGILSLYDANHSAWVPPPKVRVLEAEARVENAEARAAQAAEARAHAEKELAKALAVIEQLKEKTQD